VFTLVVAVDVVESVLDIVVALGVAVTDEAVILFSVVVVKFKVISVAFDEPSDTVTLELTDVDLSGSVDGDCVNVVAEGSIFEGVLEGARVDVFNSTSRELDF
jgi:hypothetical protein